MEREESLAVVSFAVVIAIVVALLAVPTGSSSTQTADPAALAVAAEIEPEYPGADPFRDIARQRLSDRLPLVYARTLDLSSPKVVRKRGRVTYTWHFIGPVVEDHGDVRTVSLTLAPPDTSVQAVRIR